MRAALLGTILAMSLALVWFESALVAVWAHMDFSQGEDLLWPRAVPAEWPAQPHNVMYCNSRGLKGEWYRGLGPEPVNPSENPTLFRLVEMRVGWPIQTFQFERTLVMPDARGTIGWLMDDPTSVWTGGFPIPNWVPKPDEALMNAPCIRRIPVRPLWGGLTLATAMHAAALLALWRAPLWALRSFRGARGRCKACGYDIRGLAACPECGSGHVLAGAI